MLDCVYETNKQKTKKASSRRASLLDARLPGRAGLLTTYSTVIGPAYQARGGREGWGDVDEGARHVRSCLGHDEHVLCPPPQLH